MLEPLNIVILGGGTAGWMCAAALTHLTNKKVCSITLIESDEIGSIGVGEATLPQIKEFNDLIGLNEADMMQKTNATFKVGIQFEHWGKVGNSYIHPFGTFGEKINGSDFHQQWARINSADKSPLGNYSYPIEACKQNRFEFPATDAKFINSTYSYAYHFDASLYAAHLRKHCESKLKRIQGKVAEVIQATDSGDINSLRLESGEVIHGDFFIDCSGFQSLLLKKTLNAEFDDWSKWLVCDKAFAAPSTRSRQLSPFTRSIAQPAGWQWKIPLQHRTGNGYVFCSQYISDDEAASQLLRELESPLSDPKLIQFKAGRYKQSWVKNCVAVGLASGFLEPLESTSIYLIQVAIINFIKLFPNKISNPTLAKEYNRLIDFEYERIRDFLILHYHLNQRDDSELWRYCRNMAIPDSLQEKMDIFTWRGYIHNYNYGLFAQPSWLAVFNGQGLTQHTIELFASRLPEAQLLAHLKKLESKICDRVAQMPTHEEFLADYCPATP